MYSIDWTTGSGRFEFVTSGLSEEHLGMVSYDIEVAQANRLLYEAHSEGELTPSPCLHRLLHV